MKLGQLDCFVAVVDEGSFTRAARRLGIAPPSLSQLVVAHGGHVRGDRPGRRSDARSRAAQWSSTYS